MIIHYKYLLLSLARLLKEMGPFYGILVIILVSFLGMFLYTTHSYLYSGGISLGIILLIHLNRKDVSYLKHFFKGKVYWFLLGEYFLVSLLFFIASIMNGWWPEMMFFLAALLIVPGMKSGMSSERWQNLPVIFGRSSLGMKSGFRLCYPFWLLSLSLVYIVGMLDKPNVLLVMIYFYLVVIAGLQISGDPSGYIKISRSPLMYLNRKISFGFRDYLLMIGGILPIFFSGGTYHLEEIVFALVSALFLFFINQLVYPATRDSRVLILFIQVLSLLLFIMGYFYRPMIFILSGLCLLVSIAALNRLKKDYLW